MPFRVLESSECFQCTPKLSFCLSLHPGALPESSSTPKTSMSLSVGQELSMGSSESPRVRFCAPQDSPCDFPRALQPSTCLSLCPRSPCPAFGASPGDLALPLIPRGQGARRESSAVAWASRANVLIGEKGSHRVSARPTGEEGSPPPACTQGRERKRRFGDLSFVHNPDEKESCKAEGREQRGEERRRRRCVTTNLAWEAASGYSGGVEAREAGARVSLSPATSLDAASLAGRLPPRGERHEATSGTSLKVLTCGWSVSTSLQATK